VEFAGGALPPGRKGNGVRYIGGKGRARLEGGPVSHGRWVLRWRWRRIAAAGVTLAVLATGVSSASAETAPTGTEPQAGAPDPATAGSVEFPGALDEPAPTVDGPMLTATAAAQRSAGSSALVSFPATDYVSAGVGGMRGIGSGDIAISGVTGSVRGAYLFWQGPTNTNDSGAGAHVTFDGSSITGVNVGFSDDNCWGFTNSQAYRADVTDVFHGDGTYRLSGMRGGCPVDRGTWVGLRGDHTGGL